MKIQMNNEIKVSLSVTLQGSVILSQEQAKALEKEEVGTGYDTFNVESLKDGKKDAETITVETRKCKPAGQSLNPSMDAYDYMTGKETPYFVKARD